MKFPKFLQNPFIVCLLLWYGFSWSWALFTDSLDLAGNNTQGLIVAIFVVVINAALSTLIVYQTFKYLLKKLKNKNPLVVILLGWPLFALMDLAVSWLTTIIWIGPEGSIDNVLPLSSPTLPLVNTPFAFAARIIGFYALAGAFWLVLFMLMQKKLRLYSFVVVGLLTITATVGWFVYKTPNGSTIKATVISENLQDKVAQIKPDGQHIVIFPEYGLDDITNVNLNIRIETSKDKPKTYFLGSQQINTGGPAGHLNELLFGNTVDGITVRQDKYRLIPGGEDLPFAVRTALRATNQKSTLDYFSYNKMVLKGPQALVPFNTDGTTIVGAAVCSSIIAPKDYQAFALQGATVFSNSASLTIFKGSKLFAWQQKSMARFMAVANSRYFLQSANAASAYILDNNGKQTGEVKGVNALTQEIKNNTTKTVYSNLGEYLAAIGALIAAVFALQELKKRNQPKPNTKKSHVKKSS